MTTLLILLLAVALFLFWVARKPDDFEIARSTVINAPQQRVFDLINDLHKFNQWNPWLEKEPSAGLDYTGPDVGPGAAYSWKGKKTGEGSMKIVSSAAPGNVDIDLQFLKPWKANNKVAFTLQDLGGQTRVNWAMRGRSNFMSKLFTTFMSMDQMVGKDFERGLQRLKQLAEA
jgi:uncharacterized protein YndB with AHSA1/START domain